MTEQPFRTNSTRSPFGTHAPYEPPAASSSHPPIQSRSPYQTRPPVPDPNPQASSNSRSPIPPPLERRAHPRRHAIPTVAYLLLGAILVIVGWNVPHWGKSSDQPAADTQERTLNSDRSTASSSSTNFAVSDSSSLPQVNLPREPDASEREPGLRHIATLQLAGSFAQAAEYAVNAPLDYRRDFTIAAFHEWGRQRPDLALAAAIKIEEAFTRDWAVHSVFSGWARTDPEGMAEAALAFPESDFKKAALTRAIRAWMIKDPNIAGDWIMSHPEVVPVAEEMFRRDRR